MKFVEIFKDDNSWNEKAIIGFVAFTLIVLIVLTDIISDFFLKDFSVSRYIYDSLLILVLGSFGISGAEKIMTKKPTQPPNENK